MDTDKTTALLTEIRDDQRQFFDDYRRASREALEMQKQAVEMQREALEMQRGAVAQQRLAVDNQIGHMRLYRRVLLVAAAVVGFVVWYFFKVMP